MLQNAHEPGPLPISMSRRGFLQRTAGASLFLLAAHAAPARATARKGGGLAPKNLDADAFATLEAFCERLIHPAPGAPTAAQSRVALRIDHEVGIQGRLFAEDIRDGLAVIEYSGLFEAKFKPFSNLGPEDQDDVIRGLMGSRFAWRRSSFQGLKQIIMFYYYADDRTWRSTGYDGPWIARRSIPATERNFPFPGRGGSA